MSSSNNRGIEGEKREKKKDKVHQYLNSAEHKGRRMTEWAREEADRKITKKESECTKPRDRSVPSRRETRKRGCAPFLKGLVVEHTKG